MDAVAPGLLALGRGQGRHRGGIRPLELADGVHTFMSIKVPAEGVGFPGRVLCGFSVDITARKRAEHALQESRERFRAFMDHSPARSWIKDEQGRYLFLSAAVRRGLGLDPDEGIGKTAFDLHPATIAEAITANDRTVLDSDQDHQFVETVLQDGEQRFLLAHKFPMNPGDGHRYVAGTAVDITEQIRAERMLVEADRRKNEFLATSRTSCATRSARSAMPRRYCGRAACTSVRCYGRSR